MKKPIIAVCMLVTATGAGENFQTSSTTYYPYYRNDFNCLEERIVLRNGKKICGYVKELAPLEFSFNSLPLKRSDIAFLLFSDDPAVNKVHYITREGYVFTGNYPKKPFKIMENDGVSEYNESEIDPSKIHYIALLHPNQKTNPIRGKVFNLHLADGNRLPVMIRQDTLLLTDGYHENEISVESIVTLTFNGGLKGVVRNGGRLEKIPLTFAKDQYLHAEICHTDQVIKFPWHMIASLEENTQKFLNRGEFERFHVTAGVHAVVSEQGNALEGAFGSLTISPQSIESLYDDKFDQKLEMSAPLVFTEGTKDFDFQEIAFEGQGPALSAEERNTRAKLSSISEDYFSSLLELPTISTKLNIENELASELEINEMLSAEVDRIAFISSFNSKQHKDKIAFKVRKIAVRESKDLMTSDQFIEKLFNQTIPSQKWKIVASNALVALLTKDGIVSKNIPSAPLLSEKAPQVPTQGMVFIPAQQISHQQVLPSFYIDPKPVTNLQYDQFVKATRYQAPSHWHEGKIPGGLENAPVVNVSYKDAVTYTLWAGKKLPTLQDWNRAAHQIGVEQPPINEWIMESSESVSSIGSKKSKSANKYRSVRINLHGNVIPMYRDDFNSFTGFRNIIE